MSGPEPLAVGVHRRRTHNEPQARLADRVPAVQGSLDRFVRIIFMKLIDADDLIKHEAPAKSFGPEMLVIGKGFVISSPEKGIEETWRANAAEMRVDAANYETRRLRVENAQRSVIQKNTIADLLIMHDIIHALAIEDAAGYDNFETSDNVSRFVAALENLLFPNAASQQQGEENR